MPVDGVLVSVVGCVPRHDELERVLADWQQDMAEPDGIDWVADRLRAHGIPAAAPA